MRGFYIGHFVDVNKMVKLGSGSERKIDDIEGKRIARDVKLIKDNDKGITKQKE